MGGLVWGLFSQEIGHPCGWPILAVFVTALLPFPDPLSEGLSPPLAPPRVPGQLGIPLAGSTPWSSSSLGGLFRGPLGGRGMADAEIHYLHNAHLDCSSKEHSKHGGNAICSSAYFRWCYIHHSFIPPSLSYSLLFLFLLLFQACGQPSLWPRRPPPSANEARPPAGHPIDRSI